MKVKAWAAACLLAAAAMTASAQVDDSPSRGSLLEALRRQRAELEAQRLAPTPSLTAPSTHPRQPPVDAEEPCAVLVRLAVRGLASVERALTQEFEPFAAHCAGAASLEALRRNLNLRLAEEGLITTRAELPAQALTDGVLEVLVRPGRIEAIDTSGPGGAPDDDGRRWRQALAAEVGDVLDVHRLDAALDHFNRLGGGPALFRLEPGTAEDTTRVVLVRPPRSVPRAALSADNGGTREFGRAQLDLDLVLDEPTGRLDQLRLAAGSNADPAAAFSRSLGLHYSIPWREHLFSLSAHSAWRRQTLQGTTLAFESSGRDRTLEARWAWSAWRAGDGKAGPWVALRERRSRSFLADTELVVQRHRRLVHEIGLSWWQRLGVAQWSLEASHGVGRRRGAPNPFRPDDDVTSRIDRIQVRASAETLGLPLAGWRLELRAQYGRRPASGADLFVIGAPGSVRGFSPDDALAAESGALLRLEMDLPAWRSPDLAWQPYLGWDVGLLRGPGAATLPGRRLAGAAVGVRLAIATRLQADLALSTALDAPAGPAPARWLPAIAVRFQI